MSASEDELDIDPDDAPEIEDKPGLWDNFLNGLILIIPWIALILVTGYIIRSGQLSLGNIVISGDIPAIWIYIPVAGITGLTYLLALMKFYGVAPLAYIFEKGHNFMTNYNSGNNN